ncbi:hypothetical protein PoB_006927900 [Plakobranchus ocellatus]|uniref:Uncharacterized protein n=1 Tax=Plakobranchus ocellatus TaxID=259542 RepID=A0AAV4DEZ5_9GAST|nr:hypothetical protein PoB_006927900 [Plakobranchus ocellatus]
MESSDGVDSILRYLRARLSPHCSPLFCFPVLMTYLVVACQLLRSEACASRPAGTMPPAFRSHLQTSLYRSIGLSDGLEPVAGSHTQQNVFG